MPTVIDSNSIEVTVPGNQHWAKALVRVNQPIDGDCQILLTSRIVPDHTNNDTGPVLVYPPFSERVVDHPTDFFVWVCELDRKAFLTEVKVTVDWAVVKR